MLTVCQMSPSVTKDLIWWQNRHSLKTELYLIFFGVTIYGGADRWVNINQCQNVCCKRNGRTHNVVLRARLRYHRRSCPRSTSRYRLYLPVAMTPSCVRPALCVQTMSVQRGRASSPLAQNHADLRIHQQRYNEGNVEGGHRGVHHEGWVGKAARGAFPAG